MEWLAANLDPDYAQYAEDAWNTHGKSIKGYSLWTAYKFLQGAHRIGGVFASVLGVTELKYKHEYEAYLEEQREKEIDEREQQQTKDKKASELEMQPQAEQPKD
eukprot:c7629_g1_i2.p3 GENE.c7629_g1_i2~~c7629_g1_i2.p3  ORF type:complete len:104 (+),score=28.54 c7629_g1_i2:213-524(+)